MPILTAAVIVVGVLCVLNLILIDAVIRRLREISARLGKETAKLLPVGSAIGEVPADAEAIKQGTKVVAMMSTNCSACMSALDATAAYARNLPGGPADILVAIQGEGGHLAEITAALADVTTLVTGQPAADLVTALQGRAFPTFYVLEEGRITAAAHTPLALPALSAAHRALVQSPAGA